MATSSTPREGVGIDFGTSNSAVAAFDGERVRLIPLEDEADIMPTATHYDTELAIKTGLGAIRQYIDENCGRMVELTPEVIGKAAIFTGGGGEGRAEPETLSQDIYGNDFTDRGLQGRLFRGVKRLLGRSSIKRLLVFDKPFRLVALITPVLQHMRRAIDAAVARPWSVHVGHPVNYEGREEFKNDVALTRLREAVGYAGIENSSYYPEPVAATISYLHEHGEAGRSGIALTVDFGGGTLDLSVLRFTGASFEVLATHGEPVGGDHIDQVIFREVIFPLLGKGEHWRRTVDGQEVDTLFPFEDYESLLVNWAVTYQLNQHRYLPAVVDRMEQGDAAAEKFRRLHELITRNYSYVVFQGIRRAKVALSTEETTTLDIPELDIAEPFDREQFERLLQPTLDRLRDAIDTVIAEAGLDASAIDLVIRTGGSSQINAVRAILDQRFPGKVVEHDPFTSVAAGLAIANYHGYRFEDGSGEPGEAAAGA